MGGMSVHAPLLGRFLPLFTPLAGYAANPGECHRPLIRDDAHIIAQSGGAFVMDSGALRMCRV